MTAINRLPAVMLALLLAFLVRWAGWRRVRGRVGLLLLVFLGFFSLGLLTPWPERMLTVGGLLLVGAFMLVYAGRPQATEIDSPPTAPFLQPDPGQETETTCASAPIPDAQALQPEPTGILHEAAPEPPDFYCPYCAGTLGEELG